MHLRSTTLAAALLALGTWAIPSPGDVVAFSDYDPATPAPTASTFLATGSGVTPFAASISSGFEFTAGASGHLASIEGSFLPAGGLIGGGPYGTGFVLGLYAASAGRPGALLESFDLSLGAATAATDLAATSTLRPELDAGASYFLIASAAAPTSAVAWFKSTASGTTYVDAASSVSVAGGAIPTAVVTVGPLPVPEPASSALLAAGLAALARRRRRP